MVSTKGLIQKIILSRPKKVGWAGREFLFLFFLLFFGSLNRLNADSISGTIMDLGGNPVGNASVNLTGDDTQLFVTSGDGAYTFIGLNNGGSYAVTPTFAGYAFTPATRTYPSLNGDLVGEDFVYGKQWNGAGGDSLASNPANWAGGEAPNHNDAVLFGNLGSALGCYWDYTVTLSSFHISVDYASSVVMGTDMDIGEFVMDAGEIVFGTFEHAISKNFLHNGGTFYSALNGTIRFDGNLTQMASMTVINTGPNTYGSYFYNFRIFSSSTVYSVTDMIIDGSFSITSGDFNGGSSTHTLTGGVQAGAGVGAALNWDDDDGGFTHPSGEILFVNAPRAFRINQGAANAFNHVTFHGAEQVELLSDMTVNGNLTIGDGSTDAQLNVGNLFDLEVYGQTQIGPISTPALDAFTVGYGTVTFHDDVVIGTATFTLSQGRIQFLGDEFFVGRQGTLSFPSGSLSQMSFGDGSVFEISEGTFESNSPLFMTSTAPTVSRFVTLINGTLNLQNNTTLSSLDKGGLHFGAGADPVNLGSLSFNNMPDGGAAINFDPVSVDSITIIGPHFDASVSTNVRAILISTVIADGDIYVGDPTGERSGPDYEMDPHDIIHWGILGIPLDFLGYLNGTSSITWNWTIANDPLGFTVFSTTGGAVSPPLGPNTTYYTETGLSINTAYGRYVQAHSDLGTADSNSMVVYTHVAPPNNIAYSEVNLTSMTITWDLNSNPSHTIFTIDRSTDNVQFIQVGSGAYSNIHPFTDIGLYAQTPYHHRLMVQNGNGIVLSTAIVISSTTLSVPPPNITSITPSSMTNLGTIPFTVTGSYFRTGATLVFRRNVSQVVTPATLSLEGDHTLTGTLNATGLYADTWDVFIENLDGTLSSGTGEDILTITDATSQGVVTIQNYNAAIELAFNSISGESVITMDRNAMDSGRIYLSEDPLNGPMLIDPALINTANANTTTLTIIPDSYREALAYVTTGRYTDGFHSTVNLGIGFEDRDSNGLLDNADIRVNTLQVVMLDEINGVWQALSGSVVDTTNKRVTANVDHFSVYALAGSPASSSLDQVIFYPSPWKPGSDGKFDADNLTIANLTQSGKVRIYTIHGALVQKLTYTTTDGGMVLWDGKNDSGEPVASGIYLIQIIADSGETQIIKVGVQR
jgi:hypothetical protein